MNNALQQSTAIAANAASLDRVRLALPAEVFVRLKPA